MNIEKLEKDLLKVTAAAMPKDDPSHDMEHIKRVLSAVKLICEKEQKGDLEILIPAAILHDVVTYPKDDPRNKTATDESAEFAGNLLWNYPGYPKDKTIEVRSCILECSWSKGLPASSINSAILRDADRLEAVGAIALMRTFSSGGQMKRPLYNPADPFCEKGIPEGVGCSFDLIYQRLLKVTATLHTETAKNIGLRRRIFLEVFISEFRLELSELKMSS